MSVHKRHGLNEALVQAFYPDIAYRDSLRVERSFHFGKSGPKDKWIS